MSAIPYASLTMTETDARYTVASANLRLTSDAAEQEAKWLARFAELRAIRSYTRDWDGQDSDAPDVALVDGVTEYLQSLQRRVGPPSSVALSPSGSILLIWESASEYFEAETESVGRTEWMLTRGHSKAEHWTESWSTTPKFAYAQYDRNRFGNQIR